MRRPKTIKEIRKKVTFLLVINNPMIYKFLKDFTNHRQKINGVKVFSCRPYLQGLSMRQDSFRHILKSSASMYESSGSQFFRTTTNIQSGPDAFDESRLVITFLTTLGITEILCSFRLVLEKKGR